MNKYEIGTENIYLLLYTYIGYIDTYNRSV